MQKILIVFCILLVSLRMSAQIGEHRNEIAVGVNGGYVMSNVGFNPDILKRISVG